LDSFSPVSSESEWLTLGKAAKFLGVAQSTLRVWSDDGRIATFYTPGKHRRYRREDLEAFVAGSSRSGALVREPEQPGGDQADRGE
jgi:excisionase family DNA binding protein